MNLAICSFTGLVSLVIISHITTLIFHITNDKFYSVFHLAAGILSLFFFYNFTGNYILSIILTELTGIGWEIFEWFEWKLLFKKKKLQPQPDDTRNDLIVDFIGSLVGVGILSWSMSK